MLLFKIFNKNVGLTSSDFYEHYRSRTRGLKYKIRFDKARLDTRKFMFTVRAGKKYVELSKKHVFPATKFQYKKNATKIIQLKIGSIFSLYVFCLYIYFHVL